MEFVIALSARVDVVLGLWKIGECVVSGTRNGAIEDLGEKGVSDIRGRDKRVVLDGVGRPETDLPAHDGGGGLWVASR